MTSSGQTICDSRRSRGLTQEELAEHIGVSRQTIAMWEIGKRLPAESVAILTARFLGLDEEEILSLVQHERLIFRVERLQDQYGATIIIAEAPNHGGRTMSEPKYTAYQTQQGVHFAITHIHKSIGFEYPEELLKKKEDIKTEGVKSFEASFEKTLKPEECLTIKIMIQSENEAFIPNVRYVAPPDIVDDLGNHYKPVSMGLHSSTPPQGASS